MEKSVASHSILLATLCNTLDLLTRADVLRPTSCASTSANHRKHAEREYFAKLCSNYRLFRSSTEQKICVQEGRLSFLLLQEHLLISCCGGSWQFTSISVLLCTPDDDCQTVAAGQFKPDAGHDRNPTTFFQQIQILVCLSLLKPTDSPIYATVEIITVEIIAGERPGRNTMVNSPLPFLKLVFTDSGQLDQFHPCGPTLFGSLAMFLSGIQSQNRGQLFNMLISRKVEVNSPSYFRRDTVSCFAAPAHILHTYVRTEQHLPPHRWSDPNLMHTNVWKLQFQKQPSELLVLLKLPAIEI